MCSCRRSTTGWEFLFMPSNMSLPWVCYLLYSYLVEAKATTATSLIRPTFVITRAVLFPVNSVNVCVLAPLIYMVWKTMLYIFVGAYNY